MKLLDKYMLRTLAAPLMQCMSAFLILYIIFDLFQHLDNFVEAKTPIAQIFKFYVFLMPSVLTIIMPICLLLAVLYSLSQLTRNNETTAMRASGISLYRLILPFVFVGLSVTIIVGAIHETLGPASAYWTKQFVRQERRKDTGVLVHIAHNLAIKHQLERRIWMIGEFDTKLYTMKNVEIIQQREDGSDEYKIQAAEGQWLDDAWWLSDVAVQRYDARGHPRGAPKFELRMEMSEFEETPKTFVNEIKDPEFLSSVEIIAYLNRHEHLSDDTLARIKTDLHHRLAMPWSCFVVAMLGIPFGMTTGRKGAFLGVALSIGLFFGYYVLLNFSLALGKKEVLDPWLAGWLPNIVFFALGAVMIYRMR